MSTRRECMAAHPTARPTVQCPSCGLVVPWAARCSGCGRVL